MPPTSQQKGQFPPKRVKHRHHNPFLFSPHPQESSLCSQPIRGKVRRTRRTFLEHVERSFLAPRRSFVTVRRIPWTRFAEQKFAQWRTNYARQYCWGLTTTPNYVCEAKVRPMLLPLSLACSHLSGGLTRTPPTWWSWCCWCVCDPAPWPSAPVPRAPGWPWTAVRDLRHSPLPPVDSGTKVDTPLNSRQHMTLRRSTRNEQKQRAQDAPQADGTKKKDINPTKRNLQILGAKPRFFWINKQGS